jgi:peptide/nickel transport system permease protein
MSAPLDPIIPVPAEPSEATTLAPMAAVAVDPTSIDRKPGLGVIGWIAAGWMILVILLAVLAPWLPIDDPNARGAGPRLPPFTEGHILGTDSNQRDVFSRLIWGARSSLTVGFGAIAVGLLIGGTLGLVSGFRRGRIDTLLSSLFDILLAFPPLVLALSLVAFLRPPSTGEGGPDTSGGLSTIQILIIALGIVSIPLLARITRATTLSWAQREFVLAARAQGAKNLRIMLREVLPNVLPAMFSIALLGVAVSIIAEGGLSLLGVGVQAPTASWGNMITENRNVRSAPLNALFFPIIAVFFTVMALNYLGDAIRARFDVRESAL